MAGDVVGDEQEYTRLHITPLTPALLPTFLAPSVFPTARNISYHTIETFPERAYGFVELPKMEASKLQKKLNGSILKGTKIRIETARPLNIHVPEGDPEPEKPKKERGAKRKRDEAIPAIQIGERSVQRGWTVPTSKSSKKSDKKEKKAKSKYTDGKECLFKTVVPPNKLELEEGKKRKKDSREEIVHEFEKSTKHASFLRISKVNGESKISSQFVDGKGWVDEDGNVIEEVTTRRKTTTRKEDPPVEEQTSEDDSDSSDDVEPAEPQTKPVEDDGAEKSEDERSEVSSSSEKASPEKEDTGVQDLAESSSDSSSEEESESSSESSDSEPEPAEEPLGQDVETPSESSGSGTKKPNSRPDSSSGLTITIPKPDIFATSSTPKSVHPLEALYKRPAAKPSSKDQTAASKPDVPVFSFFGDDKDTEQEEIESHDLVPLTPFTQRDFEFRGQRSAAPTPDTAHPNKRFMWPVDDESDEEDNNERGSATPSGKKQGKGTATAKKDGEAGTAPESDFQKWFYENRGDTGRAWKKRRKTAAKEIRQRENRKRTERTT